MTWPGEAFLLAHRVEEALAQADELRMSPFRAHCHMGLATLYRQMGQRPRLALSCAPLSRSFVPTT